MHIHGSARSMPQAWHALPAMHMGIHRAQIANIIAALRTPP
jgi:hypothetical protein